MILPDTNVLVYAFRTEAPHHQRYARWLNDVVAGGDELGLHDLAAGRIPPHRDQPPHRRGLDAQPARARLRPATDSTTRARWLPSGPLVWQRLEQFLDDDPGVRANLVPDALLAAVALVHGCRLATADRGFARFRGLTSFDPAA